MRVLQVLGTAALGLVGGLLAGVILQDLVARLVMRLGGDVRVTAPVLAVCGAVGVVVAVVARRRSAARISR